MKDLNNIKDDITNGLCKCVGRKKPPLHHVGISCLYDKYEKSWGLSSEDLFSKILENE